MYIFLWYLFYLIITVKGEHGTCFDTVTDIATGKTVKNVTEYCAAIPCVFRFCDNVDDIMLVEEQGNETYKTCQSLDEIQRITNLTIQSKDVNQVYKKEGNDLMRSLKTFRKDYKHLKYSNYTNSKCTGRFHVNNNSRMKLRLLEDGSVLLHLVKQNIDIVKKSRTFLVEYQSRQKFGQWQAPELAIQAYLEEYYKEDEVRFTDFYKNIGLLVSCFFLTLLLVIYGISRQPRSLAGLILMAHVFTIDFEFLLMATINLYIEIGNATKDFCRFITPIKCFSILSKYVWLTVMSFDIWWTIRGSIKRREINRRGIIHKFCMYSLWAFGGPLLIVVMAVVCEEVYLTRITKIIKSCMLHESLLYLYIPLLVMIWNVLFFGLSYINIWRIKRLLKHNSLKYNPNTKNNVNRFILYFTLFLVTSIPWIIDFIMIIQPNRPAWTEYVQDTFNMLIGVVIFAIFICKKKIITSL